MSYRYSVISSLVYSESGKRFETYGLCVEGLPCGAKMTYEDLSLNKSEVEALCNRLSGQELDPVQLGYIIEDFTDR